MAMFKRSMAAFLFLVGAGQVLGCGLPIGIEYRELYVSRIDAPERSPRGGAVSVNLVHPFTPQRTPDVVVQVDDVKREVTFVVTERQVQRFLTFDASNGMIVSRELAVTFTPKSSGAYLLKTRGGSATATVLVE